MPLPHGLYDLVLTDRAVQLLEGGAPAVGDLRNLHADEAAERLSEVLALELRREMAASTEDYRGRGRELEQPYSGQMRVRGTPELHRAVAIAAARQHKSMNAFVTEALEKAVGG